jgi:hypothetical protein
MNERLIAEIDKEIAAKRKDLEALTRARAALAGSNGTSPRRSPAKAAPNGRKRAPRGYLEEQMIKVLKAEPGLTNGDVRARLTKASYPYSLSALHVGKRLMALADAKKLKFEVKDGRYYYSPLK